MLILSLDLKSQDEKFVENYLYRNILKNYIVYNVKNNYDVDNFIRLKYDYVNIILKKDTANYSFLKGYYVYSFVIPQFEFTISCNGLVSTSDQFYNYKNFFTHT